MSVKLNAPRVAVILANDAGELVETIVQTDNRDAVRYDLLRGRKGWPSMQEAPNVWMTVMAWSAMRRENATDLEAEKFLEAALQVRTVNEAGETVRADDESQEAVPFE